MSGTERQEAGWNCTERNFINCNSWHLVLQRESKRKRWVEHLFRMREKKNSCRVVVGTPTGGPRCRWENDTKMGLEEVGWQVVDCISMPQDKD